MVAPFCLNLIDAASLSVTVPLVFDFVIVTTTSLPTVAIDVIEPLVH